MKRLLLGPHAVLEAIRSRPGQITVVLVASSAERGHKAALDEIRARGVRIDGRPTEELDAIAAGGKHQGLLALAGEYPYVGWDQVLDLPDDALIVALDEVTDPHNFGAIVRSAVAFGADAIMTLKDRAAPVTPVVVRASAGATEHASIVRVTNLARSLDELRETGRQIVGLAAEGDVSITALPPSDRGRVLVVGSEGHGLRPLVRKQCDVLAKIPMPGKIASLNASVAAGIALHAAASQR
ncbi:MAG: 23S rRNA (guanosine(2251)-2'-O)-methyltransferase RlmB [Deltaproteobacteria bacterium]|nr:23S rRNA (guanosine(2251)-2'-O)-methyltransferase RlmB [Deltaproteobacteria bacterium]